ncbi:MAG: ABC transporter substrate-binding protein, partial [Pseudomonadota bacterium]|nr:ABC transporter substrate-binding protein [Pseudomonadota bacterium]
MRATAAAFASAALFSTGAFAQPAMPKSPVSINVVDVAGNLALTQDAIEAYQKSHTNIVSKITFTKAPAPELPGKLKAMQGAGRSDIDLVLTGTDFLAAGIDQGVLM